MKRAPLWSKNKFLTAFGIQFLCFYHQVFRFSLIENIIFCLLFFDKKMLKKFAYEFQKRIDLYIFLRKLSTPLSPTEKTQYEQHCLHI